MRCQQPSIHSAARRRSVACGLTFGLAGCMRLLQAWQMVRSAQNAAGLALAPGARIRELQSGTLLGALLGVSPWPDLQAS